MNFHDALRALDLQTARAQRTLGLERAIELSMAPLGALTAWLAAAAFGLLERLPPLPASLTTIGVLCLLAALALRAVLQWRRPTPSDARNRLAVDSGLERSAFEPLEDRPSRLDPMTLALWRREKRRAAGLVDGLRAGRVRPDFIRADPLQLRFLLPVLFLVATATAREDGPPRVLGALAPDVGPLVGDKPLEIEAWISPAAYTGQTPISLTDRIGETVETPPVTEATVRVTGPVSPPRLVFHGKSGRRDYLFEKAADGAYEVRAALDGGGTLQVERFGVKARWRIAPAPDLRPLAGFTAPPRAGDGETVIFGWKAEDDFGVRALVLRLRPVDPPRGLDGAPPVDVPLPAPPGEPVSASGEAGIDMADNPYAGLEVEARVVAVDARGQEGESAPVNVRLPERAFLQPVARAAIEIRKRVLYERRPYREPQRWFAFGARADIAYDSTLPLAPQGIRRAARMLDALTTTPQDGYFRDLAVFAGLRLARSLLDVSRSAAETDASADVLWRTALRAEFGDSADAKTALEEAQRQLAEALQRGASQEEISRRTDTLRGAMENYIQALVADAIRNGQNTESQEDTQTKAGLSEQDLQRMLEQMKARAEAGDADGAQALLQRLAGLLNALEIRLTSGPARAGDEGERTMDAPTSDDLAGELESLRKDTEGATADDAGAMEDLKSRQAELSESLNRSREASGDAAQQEALDAAKRAMERAQQRLQQPDLEGAARALDEALQAMREAEGQGAGSAGDSRDPLGRAIGGAGDGGQTRVPAEVERQRAREILDELRRRAQDARRPESEREYLRRLLDRFNDS